MTSPWLRVQLKNEFPASEYCGIQQRSLRELIKLGKIRAVRLPGGQLITHKSWLDEYLLQHEIGAKVDRLVDETLRELER